MVPVTNVRYAGFIYQMLSNTISQVPNTYIKNSFAESIALSIPLGEEKLLHTLLACWGTMSLLEHARIPVN